ncbi:MAG: Sec-independent protein translocase subunit TatA/TatB [Polyangiales bacterium]
MLGFGLGELVVVAVVLLMVVGPRRLPGLLQGAGKALRELRRAGNDLRHQVGLDDFLREDPLQAPERPNAVAPPPGAVPQDAAAEPLATDEPGAPTEAPSKDSTQVECAGEPRGRGQGESAMAPPTAGEAAHTAMDGADQCEPREDAVDGRR